MSTTPPKVLALSGGVGGAKLALGLQGILDPARLAIVVNTGDDFDHLGLRICPDLDALMYTLSGLSNETLGWGQHDESWQFLNALERFGLETWFGLGDRDLATHVVRTTKLAAGEPLSLVTASMMQALGIDVTVIPMSDNTVATEIQCQDGRTLAFQHYFVRDRCEPRIADIQFSGIDTAKRAPALEALLATDELSAVIVCPSNPFVSVAPILELDGTWQILRDLACPVVLVSPIVGGQALKGPAAKMMQELNMPSSAAAVAEFYQARYPGLVAGFVLDTVDSAQSDAVRALGMTPLVTQTVMTSVADKQALARDVLAFSEAL